MAANNRVRISGGEWRSRLLSFPDVPGLRPTPDRVRQTVFNWLGQDMHGRRCLDLFAGTVVLGQESVSRGAASAQLIEAEPGLARVLQAAVARLGATGEVAVHQGDALAWLRAQPGRFDIAFVDPPFASGLWEPVLASLPAVLAVWGEDRQGAGSPWVSIVNR